jgi:hypothetical protein
VQTKGFDGVYSPELYNHKHWDWDLLEIACEIKACMEKYLSLS